jgi:hypothetical protein
MAAWVPRLTFATATVACVCLAIWFWSVEMTRAVRDFFDAIPASLAVLFTSVAAMASILALCQIKSDALPNEVRIAGWTVLAFAMIEVAYVVILFPNWTNWVLLCAAVHLPILYCLITSPTELVEVRQVGQEAEWMIYEFGDANGPLGWVRVHSTEDLTELIELVDSTQTAFYRSRLGVLFSGHRRSGVFPTVTYLRS